MTTLRPRPPRRALPLAVLLLAPLLLPLAACQPSEEEVAEERDAIQAALEEYNERLSQAYAFADPSVLEGIAATREINSVRTNIARIAAEGTRIVSDLKELTIEDLNHYQASNAYVQTFEVWDIQVQAVGSDEMISRDPAQRNRVRYQVKKEDGEWTVVWRQRIDDAGGTDGGGAAGPDAGGGAEDAGGS